MNVEMLHEIASEKVLLEAKEGRRLSGRAFDEYRKLKLEKDVSKNAEASVKAFLGQTEVIAGIKMIPGEPYPDSPGEGTISVGAELLPLASPEFESGPPREGAIELSRVVDRGIRESKTLNFADLCIREGELVWIVFIDIYALNCDGNLFDASSAAALSALLDCKIPKLEDDKAVKGEFSGKLKPANKPLLSTFAKVGNSIFLDPDLREEKAMSARYSVATTEKEELCAMQKGLSGAFSLKEIESSIDLALKKSQDLRKLL